jgi:hypothetical protein
MDVPFVIAVDGEIPPSGVGSACSSGCSDSLAVNYNPGADISDNSLCEYPNVCAYAQNFGAIPDSASGSGNTGSSSWFSFDMLADGNAFVSVDALTEFPEYVYVAVYADSCGGASDCPGSDCRVGNDYEFSLDSGSYFMHVESDLIIGDVDFDISINVSIAGCTDPDAANPNPLANSDDGSCEYIYGCTDPIAENFNLEATTEDNSCEYIYGCMDGTLLDGTPVAENYNPGATVDDNSCEYLTCEQIGAVLTLNTQAAGSEVSISVTDLNNQVLAALPDTADGQSSLSSYATYEIDLCLSQANAYTVVMNDSYGDGWQDASFAITSCEGQLVVSSGTLPDPTELDIITGTILNNVFSDTVSFAVQDCSNYTFGCTDSLAYNFDSTADTDNASCRYYGCTDANYLEYDENATDDIEPSLCLTSVVLGCLDTLAVNIDSLANTADNSMCEYPIACEDGLSGVAIQMNDSFGDGWNGASFVMTGVSGEEVYSGTILSGSSNSETVCVDPGCYSISVGGGTFDTEISWSVALTDGGDAALSGEAPETAYLSVGTSDSCSVENFAVGCMDPWASNYDETATTDDGSCNYPLSLNCSQAQDILLDNEFSGSAAFNVWFSFSNDSDGMLFNADINGSSSYSWSHTVYSGNCDSLVEEEGVLPLGDFYVMIDAGTTLNPSYTATFSLDTAVAGCTGQYANNYDQNANLDDGSCDYSCAEVASVLEINGGSFVGELYWEFIAADGLVLASGGEYGVNNSLLDSIGLCLTSGASYTFNAYDSYGDGWNGGTYSISTQCDSLPLFVQANNTGASPNNDSTIVAGDYYLESSEVFSVVSCDGIIAGCTDETADNFNSDANAEDGSCEYGGCTDSLYVEFDPFATVDDSSCVTLIVFGCTDTLAYNYDPFAMEDDGSCQYPGCTDDAFEEFDPSANVDDGSCATALCQEGESSISLVVGGGSFLSEVSWDLQLCDGSSVLAAPGAIDTSFCSSDWPANLIVVMRDSYGDGWNGNTLTLNGVVYGSEFAGGTEETAIVGDCGYGCTDPAAENYEQSSLVDDGSCTYACAAGQTPATLTLFDSFGDGGGSVTINGDYFELESGPDASFDICIDTSACTAVDYEATDSWSSENSWEISLGDSIIADGGNLGVGSLDGSVGDCISGCTDTLAENYNPEANIESGDCSYACAEGQSVVSLIMQDSFGDGWSGNSVNLASGGDTSTFTLLAGSVEQIDACINFDECTYIYHTNGSFPGEVSWSILNQDGSTVASWNGGAGSTVADTSFAGVCYIPGCTDETALNYYPNATDDDGSCIAVVEGCTDSLYAEYDTLVNVSNSDSCLTFLGSCNPLSLSVGGGAWDGEISWSITAHSDDSLLFESGDAGDFNLCLDDGCYTFNLFDSFGDGWNGANALLTYDNGESLDSLVWNTLTSGSSGYVDVDLNGDCQFAILGCTDEGADNYDPEATEDDGSCFTTVLGCTNQDALNYDALANTDDGSCYVPLCDEGFGQIDILVNTDTYVGDETSYTLTGDNGYSASYDFAFDENTSTVTNSYCVENGTMMSFDIFDSFGDGIISGGYEIYLCANSEALTEVSMIATPDNPVFQWSEEFMVVCGEIFGCMDSTALNYDADATSDDLSCEYPCPGLEAFVNVSTQTFASEMSWDLYDAANNIVASGSGLSNNENYSDRVCLDEDSTYNFNMIDSWGDGWNGGSFSISSASCDSLAFGALSSGSLGTVSFVASCGGDGDDSDDGDDNGDGEGCPAPNGWGDEVLVTGANHTIMIPAGVVPQMAEGTELIHAHVGVFYTNDNGDLVCAGSAEITPGQTVQIAAMGDDTTTPEIDGLNANDPLVWMIADCVGNVFNGVATYSNGPDVFTTNGLTFVASISELPAGPSSQSIDMPSGWSMFSTYMIADDMDMASVLSPIIDKVIIAKNNSGAAYLVEYNFNGVGDLVVGQGYQIKTTAAAELEVSGAYAFPEESPVNLTAGWNMIGYLRSDPAAADAVMANLNATGNLIIAKDYNGAAYLPEYNFNGIGDMAPGQGYQLKTNEADVLQYLSNDASYRMAAIEVTENNVSHYAKVAATDNNMTVVIEDAAWDFLPTEGAEIAAFDKNGNMVGSAIYSSPVTVVTVWGDDATTSFKEGMLVSESVSFKVWNTNEVSDFTVAKWIEGSSSYQVDGISVASTIETNNLITELNASERVLVKVINVLGQEVNMDDEPFKGTLLFSVYDDGSVERFVE